MSLQIQLTNIPDISDEQAQDCLSKWIEILRLQHWDILLEILPEAEYAFINGKDSNAHVAVTYCKLDAKICISEVSQDSFEYCLVHELVHVMLAGVDEYWDMAIDQCHAKDELNHARDLAIEQATHALARAYLDAYETIPPKRRK